LVSGNGKCNIDNQYISLERFYSSNTKFIDNVFEGYGVDSVISFFKSIGLEIVKGDDGKLFPMSYQASTVVDLLSYEIDRLNIKVLLDTKITNIIKEKDIFILDDKYKSKSLLLATGSIAYSSLGANNSGYNIASSFGHTITTLTPSLVQLCCDSKDIQEAKGVKVLSDVKLYANNQFISKKRGDVLFTNYGLSGLAILDISREVSTRLSNYEYCQLHIDLMPLLSKEALSTLLSNRVDTNSTKPITIWLQGILNKKLTDMIIKKSKIKATQERELNKKEINKIIYAIKNLKVDITDTKGFDNAEVVSGGVDTTQINPSTMQSKTVKNLFFGGEIVDIDGDRGGFNFHFAWISAMRVGVGVC
jgi:predicted Rossmann fold flavoprotein